jgi:hypothetical protein
LKNDLSGLGVNHALGALLVIKPVYNTQRQTLIFATNRSADEGDEMKTMIPIVGIVLLVASLPRVIAQSQGGIANPTLVSYKPGQVWTTDQGITATILAVEDARGVGKLVHVRVDKIPWQRCGDVQLTRVIEHLAVTEKMMQKSGLALLKDKVDLPESYMDAYRKWQGEKKHEIVKVPLQKAILIDVPGPMICNLVPSQT